MQIIYASVGLWMLLVWVGYAEKSRKKPLPHWMITFGNLSMGVYLLQQFILMGLYDHTLLPEFLGCYWLPWCGFAISLFCSLVISHFFVKTTAGRFLIG